MFFSLPAPAQFDTKNLNPPGSTYATTYNFDKTKLIRDSIRYQIFDAAPKDFMDLKIMNLKTPKIKTAKEFIYFEYQYDRFSLETPVLAAGIAAAYEQVVPVINPEAVSSNVLITNSLTNEKALVVYVDTNSNTVRLRAVTGGVLSALSSGTAYAFANASSLDADQTSSITQGYRLNNLLERVNYMQMFSRFTKFGRMEMEIYKANQTVDYTSFNMKTMMTHYRTDISNSLWNGTLGSYTLSTGEEAPTMQGIFPAMTAAGSLAMIASPGNVFNALLAGLEETRYGEGSYDRWCFASPKLILLLAQQYKLPLVRFTTGGDTRVDLNLTYINTGTNNVVLVPYQRFQAKSNSFPPSWENKIFVLDMENIEPCMWWGERTQYIGDRSTNPYTTANFSLQYVEGTYSAEHNNPLANFTIDVQY